MPHFINCSGAFSVDSKEIDDQHLQIVDILNLLYEAKQEQSLVTRRHVMDMLKRYTETHFSYEEGLIRAASYPGMGTRPLSRVDDRKDQEACAVCDRNPDLLTEEVFEFLKKWWIDHMRNAERM